MTRGKKVSRFLMGASLLVGGIITLIAGSILGTVIGGILVLFGITSYTGNRVVSLISLSLGILFISASLGIPVLGGFALSILPYLGIASIASGGYIGYSTYKRLNSN